MPTVIPGREMSSLVVAIGRPKENFMRIPIRFAFVPKPAAIAVCALLLAAAVHAQVTPLADSYTSTANPTANYGAAATLSVSGARDTAYIQFNLASIPAGSTISKATLKLFVNSVTTPGSFNVDYVNGTWSESTITYSLAPALGTTIAGSVPITLADKNQYILIDVTSAVQAWLSGSEPNDGIALVANGNFHANFDSKENAATAHPPELDVVFTAGGILQWGANELICVGSANSGTASASALAGDAANGAQPLIACGPGGGTGGGGGTFNGNETINGNLTVNGTVTGNDYWIGSNLFAFGAPYNSSNNTGNVFLGFAGNTTTTGYANTGVGSSAMLADTTGWGNTAVGANALISNTTGDGNIAMGGLTLYSNLAGSWNTATGGRALYYATSSYNTADGHDALYFTNTGGNNTAVGGEAMFYNTTGSNNTVLGYRAADDASVTGLTNATAIGAYSDVNANNALVLGSILNTNNCTAANNCGNVNVGIGTTTPGATLDVEAPSGSTGPTVNFGSTANPAALTVNGTANFAGLVNFSSAQTFPSLLSASNTFTGVETFEGEVNLWPPSGTGYGLNVSGGGVSVYANASGSNSIGVSATGTTGVDAEGTSYGVYGIGSGSTNAVGVYGAGQFGLYGWANGSGVGSYGVYGYAPGGVGTATDFIGVYGYGANVGVSGTGTIGVSGYTSTAKNSGVAGTDASTAGGYGVWGISTNGTGVYGNGTTGVYGITITACGSAPCPAGVAGMDNSAGGAVGVSATSANGTGVEASSTGYSGTGVVASSTGEFGYGVVANSTGSQGVGVQGMVGTTGYCMTATGVCGSGTTGVYGHGTGYAGYFVGNVDVVGTLSKTQGSFKIDHPLDPANKYLYHSFVESPDMMNIYNGNSVLDDKGSAWITLPDYFEALNRDFRYQLTAVGAPGPNLYIAQEIAGNRFQIAGGTPGGKVSWQVTGIRKDAYAKAHPIVPEVEKTGDERGRYLHPVEHGQPKSMGIDEYRQSKMHAAELPKPPAQPAHLAPPSAPALAAPPRVPPVPPAPQPLPKPPVPAQHAALSQPSK